MTQQTTTIFNPAPATPFDEWKAKMRWINEYLFDDEEEDEVFEDPDQYKEWLQEIFDPVYAEYVNDSVKGAMLPWPSM